MSSAVLQDIFVISHSPSGMETGKSKSEERSKLLTDPAVTSIAYEINKANKQLNQHRLQVPLPGSQHNAYPASHILLMSLQHVLQCAVCALGCSLSAGAAQPLSSPHFLRLPELQLQNGSAGSVAFCAAQLVP